MSRRRTTGKHLVEEGTTEATAAALIFATLAQTWFACMHD
jgi:hypothetical protein